LLFPAYLLVPVRKLLASFELAWRGAQQTGYQSDTASSSTHTHTHTVTHKIAMALRADNRRAGRSDLVRSAICGLSAKLCVHSVKLCTANPTNHRTVPGAAKLILPPMICSVRSSSTVSSVFIGVHRRQKIPCFLRTNILPKTRQVHRFDHLNRPQVDGSAIRRACFGCGQWAALRPMASRLLATVRAMRWTH